MAKKEIDWEQECTKLTGELKALKDAHAEQLERMAKMAEARFEEIDRLKKELDEVRTEANNKIGKLYNVHKYHCEYMDTIFKN